MDLGQWMWSEIAAEIRSQIREALAAYAPDLTNAQGPLPEANLGSISDAQHGDRIGGTLHALADAATAGFMSAAHWLKLENLAFLHLADVPSAYTGEGGKVLRVKAAVDGVEFHALTASDVGAAAATHATEHEAGGADEVDLGFLAGTLNDVQHGARAGGTLHALASAVANGFMSAAHYTRVNAVTAFIDTLLDDADAATARVTLGLGAGGAGDIWVEKAGDKMTGNLEIEKDTPQILLDGVAGNTTNRVVWQTGGTSVAFFNWNDATLTFDVGTAAGSGGSLRLTTLATVRVLLDTLGNIVVGASVATTATDGDLYVPSCAGTPTGVPSGYSGRIPVRYDRTNNIWYAYSNGAWRAH